MSYRLQLRQVCRSLWRHKHVNSVCVITLAARQGRQKFHTSDFRLIESRFCKKLLPLCFSLFVCQSSVCYSVSLLPFFLKQLNLICIQPTHALCPVVGLEDATLLYSRHKYEKKSNVSQKYFQDHKTIFEQIK